MIPARPDPERVLSTLKDFQRDTVDYAFKRMYEDDPPARRFLVADEVGLGKTMVARGIVAKVVDRLWDSVDRIDIVYICSNANIARQNINRLNVTGRPDHRLPDRITMLPRDIRHIAKNKINFVSFTPGTSFQLKSSQGKASERQLLYWLLPDDWKQDRAGAISALTGYSDRSRFESNVDAFRQRYSVDTDLQQKFQERLRDPRQAELAGKPSLEQRFRALAATLGRRTNLSDEEYVERTDVVSELRSLLAAVCVESLQPDLVILDEFQRFSDLLHGTDEASELARNLLTYQDVRVLLLSATPYKMYAVGEEALTSDHYTDLVQTIGFLQGDPERSRSFQAALSGYRKGLYQYPIDSGQLLRAQRDAIAAELKSVMVRTERLAVTADRSGMLTEVSRTDQSLLQEDISSFMKTQMVARRLGQADVLEYWKSAPYLLNFMDDYKLKEQFAAACDRGLPAELAAACACAPGFLLSKSDVEAFRPLDPANLRLRALTADMLDAGLWRLAWLPSSLSYYTPEGEFALPGAQLPTKRLVFSAWQVVPKVVAALLSYEAERRMLGAEAGTDGSFGRRRVRLLEFTRSAERLDGMPVLGMLYPSVTLAREIDPLVGRLESEGTLSLDEALRRARDKSAALLATLPASAEDGRIDETWYWAAPILMDEAADPETSRRWWGQADLAARWRNAPEIDHDPEPADEEQTGGEDRWSEHVDEARRVLGGAATLGRRPDDLADVLALLAVAGPGVSALRALSRVTGGSRRVGEIELRNQAGWIAEGVRSLFNAPAITAIVRDPDGREPYWRRVLEYSARGGFQAVLDEYAHLLVEYHGLAGKPWRAIGEQVAAEISTALRFRTANVPVDVVEPGPDGRVGLSKSLRFRSRFAVRYGGRGDDEGSHAKRETALRRAFNSPFWPFVLCSTSVGQEGLDFHLYCHAVMHWNLPSNPVDLEQREGRVHRYKGHAVRKNVAAAHAARLARKHVEDWSDPWTALFETARAQPEGHESDLIPFWLYPIEGGARIERHVPLIPLSEDADRADALRRALALYRMAFGQSRQEDLVRYLLAHVPADAVQQVAGEMCIDLSPPKPTHRGPSGATPPPEEGDAEIADEASLDALRGVLDAFTALTGEALRPAVSDFARLLDDFRVRSKGEAMQ
ncbi:MAG TPA: DEAD/DEAH box helicase [Vicinamibacterales bacterium]|nr:DEAD/DEAH box helicase [Vicinamibacterales bacterium]